MGWVYSRRVLFYCKKLLNLPVPRECGAEIAVSLRPCRKRAGAGDGAGFDKGIDYAESKKQSGDKEQEGVVRL